MGARILRARPFFYSSCSCNDIGNPWPPLRNKTTRQIKILKRLDNTCSTKQTDILQVRSFTKKGRRQKKCSLLIYINSRNHSICSRIQNFIYSRCKKLPISLDIYIKLPSFKNNTVTALNILEFLLSCTLQGKNDMLKKPFLLLLTDCFICKFSLLQPLGEVSLVLIIIFTITAISIRRYILYIFDSLYYKLYIILY